MRFFFNFQRENEEKEGTVKSKSKKNSKKEISEVDEQKKVKILQCDTFSSCGTLQLCLKLGTRILLYRPRQFL